MITSKLKSSFKSGEFWLYAVVVIGLFYLANKGITVEMITEKGTEYVSTFSSYMASAGALIAAVIFAVKRTYLKYQGIKADLEIALNTKAEDVKPPVAEPKDE